MLSRAELIFQVSDFKSRIGDGSPVQYEIRLLGSEISFPPDIDLAWTGVLSVFECNFKGYAPIPITEDMFGLPTADGATVYVQTHTLVFRYDSDEAGDDTFTETLYAVLVSTVGGVVQNWHNILEVDDPVDMTADGDIFETKYRHVALNCAE